jgi:hypothetical protein
MRTYSPVARRKENGLNAKKCLALDEVSGIKVKDPRRPDRPRSKVLAGSGETVSSEICAAALFRAPKEDLISADGK